jgi:hypothetical protein
MGATTDIAKLADAWEKGEIGPLLEHCELIYETPGGRGSYHNAKVKPHFVIDTAIHSQIMDELESRRWEAKRLREDMRARAEGYTSAKNALDLIGGLPSAEGAKVYLRIFSD